MVASEESWLKNGNFAEVVLEGTTPKSIVADCGSPSTPKNHARAKAIAQLPELLKFLVLFTERAKVLEKMNRKEVHVVMPYQDYMRMLGSLKACGFDMAKLSKEAS